MQVIVLSEFGRSGWGEGGEEFAWWCTEAPEAQRMVNITAGGSGALRHEAAARLNARVVCVGVGRHAPDDKAAHRGSKADTDGCGRVPVRKHHEREVAQE